jgi:ankyrin repeat protein
MGHRRLVHVLLDADAQINVADTLGRTPIQLAASKGHLRIVKVLSRSGAEINSVDRLGLSVFAAAAGNGHTRIAQFLQNSNADLKVIYESQIQTNKRVLHQYQHKQQQQHLLRITTDGLQHDSIGKAVSMQDL